MTKKIPYIQLFRRSFLDLDEEMKNKLFYLSLFDPTGWEVDADFGLQESDIRKEIINLLKSKQFGPFSKKFKKLSQPEKERFVTGFFYTGDAINHVLSEYFKKQKIKAEAEPPSSGFDLKININGNCNGCIGIKRFVSSLNLKDDIVNHYNNIARCDEHTEECKHLIICYFPLFGNEQPSRMKKLLSAYSHFLLEIKPATHKNETAIHIIPVNYEGMSVDGPALLETYNIVKGFYIG